MKTISYCFSIILSIVVIASGALGQTCSTNELGGVIFRDLDHDGEKDTSDPGVSDATVTAYDSSGTALGSDTSADDGTYVISNVTNGTAVRVQLSGLPSYLSSGPIGTSSLSNVRFLTNSSTCNVNFGVTYVLDYCQSNPKLVTPCYVNGDPLGNGTAADLDVLVSLDYDSSGRPVNSDDDPPGHLAANDEMGAVWGVAYQRTTSTVFVSALLKRHHGLGSLGTGGIYKVDMSDPTSPVVSDFIDLQTLGASTGTDPRTTMGDPGLPADALSGGLPTPNQDPNAYGAVGKIAFGDIDMSEDDKYLYAVSLNDKKLYKIFVNSPVETPDVSDVTGFSIPDPGCANGDYRPWALEIHDGSVYVGVTCTAQTSQNINDLELHVLKFDGSSFTTIFSSGALNYTKGFVIHASANPVPDTGTSWHPWTDDFDDVFPVASRMVGLYFIAYPQPLLSDIEFDIDGDMILGVLDRSGHQYGLANYPPDTLTPIILVDPPSGGELLRACKIGSNVWALETGGACPGGTASSDQLNGEGPGGGEYYWGDYIAISSPPTRDHEETSIGGLALLAGSGQLATTAFDPFAFETGGVIWLNNTTGDSDRRYEIYDPSALFAFGKAAGLGDLELTCDPAPVEIGNRIWVDTNKNGIQDAGESPIQGATVRLYDGGGSLVATTTTDSNGNYKFTSASNNISPNTSYTVRLDLAADYESGGPLAGYLLTSANSSTDSIDSDGVTTSGYPRISLTTDSYGQNNHTYDFGFYRVACAESDPAAIQTEVDGISRYLALLGRKALNTRTRLSRTGQCDALSAPQRASYKNRINANNTAIWTRIWSLPNPYYTECEQSVPACSSTEITSTRSQIRKRLRRYYTIVQDIMSSCRSSTEVSRILTSVTTARDAAIAEINSIDSDALTCVF